MLLAGVLEPIAIRHAFGLIAFEDALRLLLGIGALPPAGVGIRPATRPARIGLTEPEFPRAREIGRRRRSRARGEEHAEHQSCEQ